MTLTAEQVKARLLSAKFRNRQFSGLLLDQAFLAGLGNYLRVEIIWQVGLSGKRKAAELSDSQLDALAHALLDIRGCPIVLAVWWMTTSIMARCFALRSSIAMEKGANAVGSH